jgi:hypothetical protein
MVESTTDMRPTRILVLALASLALAAPEALAAEARFGVRAGLTSDPDSIVIGGHVSIEGLLPDLEGLRLEPSLVVGFGDEELGFGADLDYTTLRIDGNLAYVLPIAEDRGIEIYPLAGVAFYRLSFRDCDDDLDGECDDSEVGLNLGGGISYRGFALDLVAGIGDIPELALTASYTFGR